MKTFFHHLGSLRLTVALLLASMAIVFFGTLDQTHFGIHIVQRAYFESLLVGYPLDTATWKLLPGIGDALAAMNLRIPMPGGFLVGALLVVNLVAAHFRYFRPGWSRLGIAVTHAGVLLLVISGFATAALQREAMTTIAEGASANWAADFHACELAVVDTTDAKEDRVTVVPEALLKTDDQSPDLTLTGTPFRARIRAYFPNAPVLGPAMAASMPDLKPVKVDNGIAAKTSLVILPREETFAPNTRNSPSAVVELLDAKGTLGTWLVNTDLAGTFPAQTFTHDGRSYTIALRMARTYFPFSIHLNKFTFDKYPGTEIPKNFASDVLVRDPREAGERAVTISMNKPLRHGGYTFYQANFNQGAAGSSTALQTVKNPGYLLPYAAITLVGLGMLIHFAIALVRFAGGKRAA